MTDEKQVARITGYTIIIVFILVFGTTIAFTIRHFIAQNKTVVVYLPKIGELKVEQPFISQGMPIGEIVSVRENVYNGVAVTIALKRNITIHQGYQIYCSDVGLFGTKREVVLVNGPESAPKVSNLKNLKGSYYIGMTEVISSVGKLERGMNTVRTLFKKYLAGDSTALKLVSAIDKISNNSEGINQKINEINTFVSDTLSEKIENLETGISKAKTFEAKVNTKVPELRKDLENVLSVVDSVVLSLPSIIDQVNKSSAKVSTLNEKESLNKLSSELKALQTKFDYASENAHHLLLILRKYE